MLCIRAASSLHRVETLLPEALVVVANMPFPLLSFSRRLFWLLGVGTAMA